MRSALPQSVSVEPLDRPDPAGAGILRPEAVGLPRDPWMGASGQAVIAALPDDPVTLLPASRRLLVTLLSVEQTPPATDSAAFLLARIDTLLSMGQLPRAASLMEAAGLTDPDIFRRWFDAELLTNNGNRACSRLRSLPDISPTYSARIFCLARGGDWHAAALTLKTGEALNVISSDDSALLARFLDVDLFEDMPPLQIPATPTPLTFAMFEAIGQSIPTARLPLAFAHTDLRTIAGWKAGWRPPNGWPRRRTAARAAVRDLRRTPRRRLGRSLGTGFGRPGPARGHRRRGGDRPWPGAVARLG